jgi:flagellar biosynthetic protein FliR
MITVTSAQLDTWLAMFLWPLSRILALISTDPIFGNRAVPVRVKMGIALLLTLLVVPTLGPMPAVQPGSAAGLFILMQQVVIGIAMGLAMRVVFIAVEMAGHMIGLQMGLGFATFFDPQNSAQVPVVAQFLGLFAILVFLAIDGHLMVIATLAESFQVLPIAAQPLSPVAWKHLVDWGAEIFSAGLLLSLPVIAALLITNLALGIMTRAAPQLNIFAVGFPITLMVGFLVLYLSMPFFVPLLERLFHQGLDATTQTLRAARPVLP